jgi:prevent-host-death family protein
MGQTTMSSREFNQDLAAAKRAAKDGPVIVTDRGEPTFVLLTHVDYRRLSGQTGRSLVDLLRQDEPEADFPFVAPQANGLVRPADLD